MRLGIYGFPRHHDCIEEIRRLQPSCVKAFASVTSNDWWRSVHQAAPGALRVLVHGEVSDNPDLSSPVTDAEATATYLDGKPDCPRLAILKNEPSIWDGAAKRQAVVAYTTRWLTRAHALGLNGVVGEFNSGWPRVSLLDDEDWWPEFATVDAAMNAGDYWGLHEYWGKAGPLAWWPWTVGRHLRCPTSHNILIDECGFDGNTDGLGYNQGWAGVLTAEQYVEHIVQFHRMLECDPRVKGTALFVFDYDSANWRNFDTWPLHDQLIARAAECDTVLPEVTVPSRLHLPVSSYVRISQTFAEHQASNPKGGWGLDLSCTLRTSVLAAADGVVDKVLDYGAESYGKMVQINHWWGFTRYAHLDTLPLKKGDGVDAGDPIAFSGSTGHSTGPHLHFEVVPFSNRAPNPRVDPAPLLGLGGDVVPVPTPTPTPSPSPVTPEELAVARTRFTDGAIGFLDKVATKKGLNSFGYEWDRGGYKFLLAGRAGTSEIVVLKCPSGRYEESLVTFSTL
jgi:hypothetical protein